MSGFENEYMMHYGVYNGVKFWELELIGFVVF